MDLIILGSGTFVPELKRNCSGYLIMNKKEKILFDFGRGTMQNLLRAKINMYEINNIFITHMHTDHALELPAFISLMLTNPEKRELKENYNIYGPRGIKRKIKKLLKVYNLHRHKNIKLIKIKELSHKEIIKINNISITAYKAEHDKEVNCLSYKIEENKKSIFYSGDSIFNEDMMDYCKNVDLGILESTLPKHDEHMSGVEAGLIARKANIKNLIITHVAKKYLPYVLKDVKKEFLGEVRIARDLMHIKI